MKDSTRIAIILDRSGSMNDVREATVAGFNEFIRKQKETPGHATVKLVQFDDVYEEVFDKPLKDVPELTQDQFKPRGSTALLDAQGRTITTIGAELAALPEDQRPARVIVVTLTDGFENASVEYRPLPFGVDPKKHPEQDGMGRIAAMIQHQRDVYKWEFVFLGANQDAVAVAAKMSIPMNAAITYTANAASLNNVMAAASNFVSSYRGGSRSMSFSAEDRVKAMVDEDQATSQTVVVP